MSELIKKTFISACREFFGKKEGQSLQDFAAEVKAVQGPDREEMIKLFKTVGIDATGTA